MIRWGLEHGKYAYEADSAFDYAKKIERFQMMDIADKIAQDILIAGANKDHCNCGNVKLVFDTFMNWIIQMKSEDR